MRDVLVHARTHHVREDAVAYAADLAARLDGLLTGAYVQPSPFDRMPPYVSAELLEAIAAQARAAERAAQAAGEAFVAWAATIGARGAAWQVAEGEAPQALAHLGNWHDVLVLGRDPAFPWGEPAGLAEILLQARMPCIVVPQGKRQAPLHRIALGWNGTPEAVRAMHAALPLLRHAAHVVLLAGTPRDPYAETGWRPPFDPQVHLARHSIAAERVEIAASDAAAGDALLAAAADAAADLLVMGAYGRSRFSEWMLGGATRTVLREAALPVFLRA